MEIVGLPLLHTRIEKIHPIYIYKAIVFLNGPDAEQLQTTI